MLLFFLIVYKVPASAYVDIVKKLQQKVSFQLWVGIVSFLGNTPNPIEFPLKTNEIIRQVQQVVPSLDAASDVFVAGHSLGGVMAQLSAGNHSGLVLWGAYITNHKYGTYGTSTLTLGAELDGLTRVTRIAEDFAVYKQKQLLNKPVVVIPGASHSQFCNQTVKGDLKPELTLAEAQDAITELTAAYLYVQAKDPSISTLLRETAKNLLAKAATITNEMVSGFLHARELEQSQYCADSQSVVLERQIATSELHRLQITNKAYDNLFSFVGSKPNITGTIGNTDSHNSYPLNPVDVSTIPVSANEIACKMKSLEAITHALNTTVTSKDAVTCIYVNQILMQAVPSLVTPASYKRYQQWGKPIVLQDDLQYTAGPTWVAAGLHFEITPTRVQVASPALHTDMSAPFGLGGMQYCKLFSPAKAVEWILVDSLKMDTN